MYIYFYDSGGLRCAHLKLWWAQMNIPHCSPKAKNCPSGPKTVPPRNLIVI